MNINTLVLGGRITRDIELRRTNSGKAVATIGLAWNPPPRDGQDQPALYINAVCWDRQAEIAAQYLGKGMPCVVEGALKPNEYTSQSGEVRKSVEIQVHRLHLPPKGGQEQPAAASGGSPGPYRAPAPSAQPLPPRKAEPRDSGYEPAASPAMDDDLPF